jgi:carbamoyl-phosphate synthase/aspartate carbamoyltransferase/dihydroorotase/carbamoyl-phosphate synthase/aspartate carbamoyltransferase
MVSTYPAISDVKLHRQHILSVDQFDKETIERFLYRAQDLEHGHSDAQRAQMLQGKTLACIFFEPSTRTSSSFIAAMQKLGGNVIPITQGVQFSSISKGETLEDTIVTLGQYAEAIVMRHPETGAAARAAKVSPVPIINAGDGTGEHPSQALLDLLTIKREMGRIDGLHIVMAGDLAYGRTVHSLTKLLLHYDVKLSFVSPRKLELPESILEQVRAVGKGWDVCSKIDDIAPKADVLYMTRVQKERFVFQSDYDEVKDHCILTPALVKSMRPTARILHPLPRVNEIPTEIDSDPRAAYFRQVRNGLYARMTLLTMVLGSP